MNRQQRRIRTVIQKLVEQEIDSRSVLNERINTPQKFSADFQIGRFLQKCINMILNQVKRNVGDRNVKVTHGPTHNNGTSHVEFDGYARSDIGVSVSLTSVYYNHDVEFEVAIHTPQNPAPGSLKETWTVDGDKNPEKTLNDVARYIIGTAFQYDTKLK